MPPSPPPRSSSHFNPNFFGDRSTPLVDYETGAVSFIFHRGSFIPDQYSEVRHLISSCWLLHGPIFEGGYNLKQPVFDDSQTTKTHWNQLSKARTAIQAAVKAVRPLCKRIAITQSGIKSDSAWVDVLFTWRPPPSRSDDPRYSRHWAGVYDLTARTTTMFSPDPKDPLRNTAKPLAATWIATRVFDAFGNAQREALTGPGGWPLRIEALKISEPAMQAMTVSEMAACDSTSTVSGTCILSIPAKAKVCSACERQLTTQLEVSIADAAGAAMLDDFSDSCVLGCSDIDSELAGLEEALRNQLKALFSSWSPHDLAACAQASRASGRVLSPGVVRICCAFLELVLKFSDGTPRATRTAADEERARLWLGVTALGVMRGAAAFKQRKKWRLRPLGCHGQAHVLDELDELDEGWGGAARANADTGAASFSTHGSDDGGNDGNGELSIVLSLAAADGDSGVGDSAGGYGSSGEDGESGGGSSRSSSSSSSEANFPCVAKWRMGMPPPRVKVTLPRSGAAGGSYAFAALGLGSWRQAERDGCKQHCPGGYQARLRDSFLPPGVVVSPVNPYLLLSAGACKVAKAKPGTNEHYDYIGRCVRALPSCVEWHWEDKRGNKKRARCSVGAKLAGDIDAEAGVVDAEGP